MSYCSKDITIHSIDSSFGKDDLEFTLASCEQSCDRFYGCDTAAYMIDKLKDEERENK